MNELHRQKYLSALGVDTYMPRWSLPFAPVSVQCDLSIEVLDLSVQKIPEKLAEQSQPIINYQAAVGNISSAEPTAINNLIDNIFQTKNIEKPVASSVTPETILAQLQSKFETIEPFSLSIWRPIDRVMIVDSRNTKLALPTELLLKNILGYIFPNQQLQLQEEVLRWPMIENSFSKRSIEDACNELQTWLSVQHEIRPIKYIWLMGSESCAYLLPQNVALAELLFSSVTLNATSISALILPSLNEILQNPTSKRKLYSALRRYHA